MPRTKKKFVEKGSSTKFVLLHRSQQDADYGKEGASEFVLYPMDRPRKPGAASEEAGFGDEPVALLTGRDHVNRFGMANDGYDYEKHMRSIDGNGLFVSASGKVSASTALPTAATLPAEAMASTEKENERMLEAITLSDACMDADIRAAMYDPTYDNGELDDDIMQQMVTIAEHEEDDDKSAFDYDAHIAKLIAASQNDLGLIEDLSSGEEDDDEADGESEDEDRAGTRGGVRRGSPSLQDVRVEKNFERALLEYDSDECGPLEDPDDDPAMQGHIPVDSEDFGAILEEYIEEETLRRGQLGVLEAAKKPFAGTEIEAGNGTTGIKAVADLMSQAVEAAVTLEPVPSKDDREDDAESDAESDSGDEDYMPDYLKPKEQLQWDCETIISTYSNLDNHPVQLRDPPLSARGKKSPVKGRPSSSLDSSTHDEPKRIVLSEKSGLPLGVLSTKAAADAPTGEARENKGFARSKQESKEEKKLRKLRVKEERQEKRKMKGKLKAAYKDDEMEQQKRGAQQRLGGVATFKY